MNAFMIPGHMYPKTPKGAMPIEWTGELELGDEPLQAFRAWKCTWQYTSLSRPANGGPMPERLYHLTSLYSQYKWPHYEKAIAVCPHLIRKEGITNLSHALYSTSYIGHERYLDHHSGEPVPKPGCSCGFYAQPTLEGVPVSSLLPTPQGQIELPMIYVAGSIRIWGKVVEAEHGWRAQFAYPERLFIVIPDNRTMDNVFKPRMEMFRQGLLDGYGVPVGYCQRDDFGNLTQALLD